MIRSATIFGITFLVGLLAGNLLWSAEVPQLVRLTEDGLFKQRPIWSPDGQWLVFARHRGATIFLFLRSADGREERRLTTTKDPEYDAVFSPDGKRLLFAYDKSSPNQGDIEIYSIERETNAITPVVTTQRQLSHEEWPSWSPDGTMLAFTSNRDGNFNIYLMDSSGGRPRRATLNAGIDNFPSFSPQGELTFVSQVSGGFDIFLLRNPAQLAVPP